MTGSSRPGRRSPADGSDAGGAGPASRGTGFGDDSRTVRDVGDVSILVAQRLQRAFPEPLWVRGEVVDCTFADDGTVRFVLTEEGVDGDRARPHELHVMLPPEQLARVRAALVVHAIDPRDLLFDGQSVLVSGRLTYSESDRVELRMDGVDHQSTTGMLAAAKVEARARLQAAGLHTRQRALALPVAPTAVSIIGPNRGSAIDDALHELTRCEFSVATHTFAVRLEGRGAVDELAEAIARAAKGSQLVLLVRDDDRHTSRAPFESERVAAAIAAAPVPVLTGVDVHGEPTLADEVAARSLGTPARAASDTVQRLRAALRRLHAVERHTLERARGALDRIASDYGRTSRKVTRALRNAEARARRTGRRRQLTRAALGVVLVAGLATVTALASPLQRALLVAVLVTAGLLIARQLTARGDDPSMKRQETPTPPRQRTFEQAVARLEEIAALLPAVTSPEQVVDLSREANELRRWCESTLGWAEQSLSATAAPPARAIDGPARADRTLPDPDRDGPDRDRPDRDGATEPATPATRPARTRQPGTKSGSAGSTTPSGSARSSKSSGSSGSK